MRGTSVSISICPGLADCPRRPTAVPATPKKAVPNAASKQSPSKQTAKDKSVSAKSVSGAGHKAGMQKHQPSRPAAGASQASKEGRVVFAGVDVPGKEFAKGKKVSWQNTSWAITLPHVETWTAGVQHADKTNRRL